MKIATFNINDVNKRFDNLLDWLAASEPDVVCLQELKAETNAFPSGALAQFGYRAVWQGQRSWNGVAMLAKGSEPVAIRRQLPGDLGDAQARYLEAAVDGVVIASIYAPNGNPRPGPKFDYKLAWLERLVAHAADLRRAGVPVVLAGDFNVVPTEADIYQPHRWHDDALLQPEARATFARLLAQGWTDALGAHPPSATPWTFWSYLRNRWPNDHGLRIDHMLVSPDMAGKVTEVGIDRDVRGEPGASDHAPVWIELDTSLARGAHHGR